MSSVTRPRRTQEERSTAMRERLLDATIACLVEYGYSGTTVTRVADRAGVTRGAQVHHYRTKEDLVIAAVQHVAVKRTVASLGDLDKLKRSKDLVGDILDLLWDIHQGPLFVAAVELWVAARTDPVLRESVENFELLVNENIAKALDVRIEGLPDPRHLAGAVYTTMDAIRGLLISTWGLPPAKVRARWRRARTLLRAGFETL